MLEILIAYIKATFENSMPNITEVQGLAEKINEGDKQYPALYCTGGEYKHISTLENYLYFRQTRSATEQESDEDSVSGCDYLITRTYPMVAVAYIPKSVYNTDNAFIDGKIAQNIANIITKANWQSLGVTLKTENIYAEVGEINTNRHEVWASEYRGVDFAARLDHVFVSVEFDIIVEASETCLQNYDCNDVEIEIEGATITVEITDAEAWHKSGDFLPEIKAIGSTNNKDWRLIHNNVTIATITAAGVKLDVLNARATPAQVFLTTESGVVKSRTAAEVRSDIGAGVGNVTSVGLVAGSAGSDVNISGSPITGAGNIIINIPSAGPTTRGVVTTLAQAFTGVKTFNNDIILLGNIIDGGGANASISIKGTDNARRLEISTSTTGVVLTGVGNVTNAITLASGTTTFQVIGSGHGHIIGSLAGGNNSCHFDEGGFGFGFATDPSAMIHARGKLNATILLLETSTQAAIVNARENAGVRQIGFFGNTPVARPVVPTGSTTNTLITALQNLGLISQA